MRTTLSFPGSGALADRPVLVLTLCLAMLGACGPTERPAAPLSPAAAGAATPAAEAGPPVEGDWVVRHLNGEPNLLNPMLHSTQVEFYVDELLFDGCVNINPDLTPLIDTEQGMCDHFEVSPDGKTYTFRLRPGVKWHDGHPLTSRDVAYGLELLRDPKTPAFSQRSNIEEVERVEVVDDRTFRTHLTEPIATGIWKSWIDPVPTHVLEQEQAEFKGRGEEWSYGKSKTLREPVGSGSYRFVKWETGRVIELERWDGYLGPRPSVDRVLFRVITDNTVAINALKAEEIDELKLTAQQYATQTDTPDFTRVANRYSRDEWGFAHCAWNMDGSNPFFADRNVRRSLAMAVDVDGIIKNLRYGLYRRSLGIFHPTHWAFNPEIQPLAYDPPSAEQQLAAAGWTDTNGDGLRDKDGTAFSFELVVANDPTILELAEAVKEYWSKVGVEAKIRPLEWATMHEKVQSHDFQAECAGWGTGVDPDYSYNLWHSSQYKDGRNYGRYDNSRVDELFTQGRYELDRAKRAALYREAQKLIYEDQPYLFLWHSAALWAVNKRIRGVTLSPRGAFITHPGFLGWWVPKAEQKYTPGRAAALVPPGAPATMARRPPTLPPPAGGGR